MSAPNDPKALLVSVSNLPGKGLSDLIGPGQGPITGSWDRIIALAAAVVNLTPEAQGGTTIQGNVAAVPIPAGCTITGLFTSISVASGTVLAYRTFYAKTSAVPPSVPPV